MVRSVRLFAIRSAACLVALAVCSVPAFAQYVDEEPVGRLTIGGVLGAQVPGMGDVNDNFSTVNRFLAADEIRRLDDVNVALATGLDVRYKFSERLSLGLTWGALNARSSFDVSRVAVRFFSRATTYQASAYYHFPKVEEFNERLQAYVGGGFMLLRSGLVDWSLVDRTTNFYIEEGDLAELSGAGKAHGDGTGFSFLVGGAFMLNSRFSVAADVGYRFAKISDLELNSDEIEGFVERFGIGEGEDDDRPDLREPGDWAVYDFFLRDPNAETPDGRKRTDPKVPGEEQTGCEDCPLYFSGGPLEVDYGGPFATVSFRVHF